MGKDYLTGNKGPHDCTLFLAIRSIEANCRITKNPKKKQKKTKKHHYIVFLTREVGRRQKIQMTEKHYI